MLTAQKSKLEKSSWSLSLKQSATLTNPIRGEYKLWILQVTPHTILLILPLSELHHFNDHLEDAKYEYEDAEKVVRFYLIKLLFTILVC